MFLDNRQRQREMGKGDSSMGGLGSMPRSVAQLGPIVRSLSGQPRSLRVFHAASCQPFTPGSE